MNNLITGGLLFLARVGCPKFGQIHDSVTRIGQAAASGPNGWAV
jgi:hypothetical protein